MVIKNLANQLYWHKKSQCEREQRPFDLTPEWIEERLQKGTCEMTGVKFQLSTGRKKAPFQPSLDQILPGAGYTQDNVQLVCLCYNFAKHTFHPADVLIMAEGLLNTHLRKRKERQQAYE
jgi:hypothetical protein